MLMKILGLTTTLILLFLSFMASASELSEGPDRLDGAWKLDWDRSESFEPAMKALETPWLLRRLAGIARVGLELRALPTAADCEGCSEKVLITLSTPISDKEVEVILDGMPRPGEDPRGRATVDRYTWTSDAGLEMIREVELPSGKQARIIETRNLGDDADTMISRLMVWVEGSERASIERIFVRTSD